MNSVSVLTANDGPILGVFVNPVAAMEWADESIRWSPTTSALAGDISPAWIGIAPDSGVLRVATYEVRG